MLHHIDTVFDDQSQGLVRVFARSFPIITSSIFLGETIGGLVGQLVDFYVNKISD